MTLKSIWESNRIKRGLYRGFWPSITYYYLDSLARRKVRMMNEKIRHQNDPFGGKPQSILPHLLPVGYYMTAIVFMFPIDTVRSLLMTDADRRVPRYYSTMSCVKTHYSRYGMRGFYRGFSIFWMQTSLIGLMSMGITAMML
jgi:hypothetical protein